jgi:transcriptional regulator GlxA family with amidase domain
MKRARVAMVAYPDVQLLDVVGPLEVFARTTRWLEEKGLRSRGPAYDVEVVAPRRGRLRASSGLSLFADRALSGLRGPLDTVLVAGGRGTAKACEDPGILRALRRLEPRVRRFGSVCTGAFLLAEAGMLDGHLVTSHWQLAAELARRYPNVRVDADAIYIGDGHLYTSAGVTAGIDLALALVEEDHGRDVALGVARELVVFARRPGGQSQFSVHLATQLTERDSLRDTQRWMLEHPADDLSVDAVARRAAMSPRNFARVFKRDVGATPATWVEAMRVERARELLEETERNVEEVAVRCGFGSAETMRRAFLRRVKVPPSAYRERFRARASEPRETGESTVEKRP